MVSSLCSGASAQSFVNLDFEAIKPDSIAPDGIWLTWNLAAPGWNRPRGGDSVFVYHNTPPSDSIAQWYFLADYTSQDMSPLQGSYSLALVSGHYNRSDPNSAFMNAYIEQQGLIPEGMKSLHLFADGDVSLTLNSQEIPLSREGGYLLTGDISKYAGEIVTLRITSLATEIQKPVLVDNIGFSLQPIPEASASSLMLCGMAVMWGQARWRARRQKTQSR